MRLSSSLLVAGLVATGVRAQTACNGNAALCDRKYSNVSQIGDHDSAFVGTFVTDNQGLSVTDQLDSGIRFLQGQLHLFLGMYNLSLAFSSYASSVSFKLVLEFDFLTVRYEKRNFILT